MLIVGGGPAGSVLAARLAASGKRVLVAEQSHFPRHKLCGEFISPECLEKLDELGVRDRMMAAGATRIREMILAGADGKSVELPLSVLNAEAEFALGFSRANLDAILLDRARELGAEVVEGTRVASGIKPVAGHYRVQAMDPDGQKLDFTARIVVNAAGRGSSFAATPTSRRNMLEMALHRSRLFGCKVHLRGIDPQARINGLYFFDGGYGGLAHIEGGLTNLCMLIDEKLLTHASQDRNELLERTIRQNPMAREILKDAVPDGSWLSTGPVSFGKSERPTDESDEIRVGDAYAFIDPFTGSGILRALDGAVLIAGIVDRAFDRGTASTQNVRIECDRALRAVYSQKLRVSSILRRLASDEKRRAIVRNILTHVPGLARAIARATR